MARWRVVIPLWNGIKTFTSPGRWSEEKMYGVHFLANRRDGALGSCHPFMERDQNLYLPRALERRENVRCTFFSEQARWRVGELSSLYGTGSKPLPPQGAGAKRKCTAYIF